MTKYLAEIGVKEEANVDSRLFSREDDETRNKKFEEQRKEHGFDERETWDLAYSSICWFYSHLRMYKEVAGDVIDLDYYTFDIDLDSETQNRSLGECIDIVLKYFKEYLIFENEESSNLEEDKALEVQSDVEKGFDILKRILFYLWW